MTKEIDIRKFVTKKDINLIMEEISDIKMELIKLELRMVIKLGGMIAVAISLITIIREI